MSAPIPRWNLKKANKSMFSKDLDSIVKWIPQTQGSYNRFAKAIIASAKRNIPRGYRKEYIPGWNSHCENLMDDYRENGSEDVADALMQALDVQRRKSWMDKTEELNFTYSSRKAWNLIRKLGSTQEHATNQTNKPTANNIAKHLMKSSK